LITTQLVSLKIFDIYEREPRAEALALEISTIVNFTKASMAASATDKRVQLLNELSSACYPKSNPKAASWNAYRY
jgi:two-component system osmolarity sensor histidine kinase EnvZ